MSRLVNNMQPTWTTIQEARRWASLFLQQHHREPRVADLLLEHELNRSFAMLLAYEHEEFPIDKKRRFIEQIEAHAYYGTPVQHLTGSASFYGRDFSVSRDVLIPRPETEELVAGVIEECRRLELQAPHMADLGTGSGVIAITLALELPGAEVFASDISAAALHVAEKNSRALEADVGFFQGHFLEPLRNQKLDCIVSNPPYIARSEADSLSDTVKNFDPELALFAEDEGLAAYKIILKQMKRYELTPSIVAFEIGFQQGQAVKELIEKEIGYRAAIRQDINQKDRMVLAVKD
ncbi:peptide chain release factor N(5)-glutamine methyltransferase [Halobacillus salinarum]|uniref:Release factor glutamine methyltransferase n=1 Tax=Halobacillus salinarum TaxID=2932257 RepID=A0ABY4ET90_9BACI|nr:peptide chain release factor N(5)-glutamine methyltransferase [Halobacillus salinarum]UOQ45341.1 peptide chain release factor N(5)-glutamine methyltransferase [Halobacillus salinarum]